MARGWSITRTEAGSVVRRSTDVEPGDTLVTTLADGTVTSTVAAVAPGEDPPDAV
jgi:exodeoxyribonuclease VII large subunit